MKTLALIKYLLKSYFKYGNKEVRIGLIDTRLPNNELRAIGSIYLAKVRHYTQTEEAGGITVFEPITQEFLHIGASNINKITEDWE